MVVVEDFVIILSEIDVKDYGTSYVEVNISVGNYDLLIIVNVHLFEGSLMDIYAISQRIFISRVEDHHDSEVHKHIYVDEVISV